MARHAARHPVPSGDGGVCGETGGTSRLLPPAGPTAPTPRRTGDNPPPGVFKPPRRDALGTWKGGGGRGARHAPTGHRPRRRPPTAASPRPAAARGPRRRRPVTAGGHTPPRAGRTPPRGPPAAAAARRPPPPSTPRRGQSPFPAPPTLTHPGAAGPAGPRPLAPAHRGGGALPAPAFPGNLKIILYKEKILCVYYFLTYQSW